MSELGIENFYLEIIEYCDISKLNEREEHYITIFDSIKNGYNNGHSSNFLDGENNPNAKITSRIVEEIRILQSKCELTRAQIYEKYKELMSYANFYIYAIIKPGYLLNKSLILKKFYHGTKALWKRIKKV